ncbi:MAG: hypothetical protein ABFE02_17645 [Sulfuricella sp.]
MITCTFSETHDSPAEFHYSRPAECLKCGMEYDLDDSDYVTVDGAGILCPGDCWLLCPVCENPVHDRNGKWNHHVLQEGVVKRGSKWLHAECEAQTILDMDILRG